MPILHVQNILKEMTVNSLILSVNLQELRPQNPTAAAAAKRHPLEERIPGAAAAGAKGYPTEGPGGQVLTAGLSIGQAGALGLVSHLYKHRKPAAVAAAITRRSILSTESHTLKQLRDFADTLLQMSSPPVISLLSSPRWTRSSS
jgi:hypothetical protein